MNLNFLKLFDFDRVNHHETLKNYNWFFSQNAPNFQCKSLFKIQNACVDTSIIADGKDHGRILPSEGVTSMQVCLSEWQKFNIQ